MLKVKKSVSVLFCGLQMLEPHAVACFTQPFGPKPTQLQRNLQPYREKGLLAVCADKYRDDLQRASSRFLSQLPSHPGTKYDLPSTIDCPQSPPAETCNQPKIPTAVHYAVSVLVATVSWRMSWGNSTSSRSGTCDCQKTCL